MLFMWIDSRKGLLTPVLHSRELIAAAEYFGLCCCQDSDVELYSHTLHAIVLSLLNLFFLRVSLRKKWETLTFRISLPLAASRL